MLHCRPSRFVRWHFLCNKKYDEIALIVTLTVLIAYIRILLGGASATGQTNGVMV